MGEWEAEIEVDEALARALIADRFPELDVVTLCRLGEGWDNTVWLTADGTAFRFPRRQIAIAGVAREMRILPQLAPRLPVAIPDAAYRAGPSAEFPWPWFGSAFIAGTELAVAGLDQTQRDALAPEFARCLRSLHRLQLPATAQLPLDPLGRGDMAHRVPRARAALDAVSPVWAGHAGARAVLTEAEGLPAPTEAVLVHGDLNVRHLLVSEAGTLAGVIDWGDLARGPRSIDLALYWSLFSPAARVQFGRVYGSLDDETLLRARVLALFFDATLAAYALDKGMPELALECRRGLERSLVD